MTDDVPPRRVRPGAMPREEVKAMPHDPSSPSPPETGPAVSQRKPDRLGPARGVLLGLVLSVLAWIGLFALWRWVD
jgi:hypothetical protein